MKKFIAMLSFFSLIMAITAIPVLAVTDTQYWGFEMNNRYVNGKDNGNVHSLHDGSVVFSGTVTTSSKDAGANSTTNPITFWLWEDDNGWNPNELVGSSFSVTPSTTVGGYVSVYKNFGALDADGSSDVTGEYFIEVGKNNDDGYNLSGSGTMVSTFTP
ncbi:hypothetical protein [Cohnella hashimotonis]|uniref:Uncharacterized protein n=1 Tax=Cohnella hashimotonis TaxID=2826895 RepID=A0ABT6T9I2_9BACL|nr:hypothetical protein [Cohnella hashimotonis]MDI4643476.1 hypothetical protein [Cohnella hashimotonis]